MNAYRLLRAIFLFLLLFIAPFGATALTQSSSSIRHLAPAAQAAISNVLGQDDPAFHWSSDRANWRATNPNQSLTVELNEQGVQVVSGGHRWGLALRGYGYGADLQAVSGKTAHSTLENRIQFARGALTEWYTNGPLGLEQGSTLPAPPQGGQRGALMLAFGVAGDLAVRIDPDQRGLALLDPEGNAVLRYAGLTATDANGRVLRSWMEITPMARIGPSGSNQGLALYVDDTNARYPLEVDPLFESARLKSSDGATADNFGSSVAVSGNRVVIGAPYHTVGSNFSQGESYGFPPIPL